MGDLTEDTLRAAGWVEDCGGQWHHDAYPGQWMSFWLAVCFERARSASPETKALAQRAVEACQKREAELAALPPAEREKAIQEWARGLAEESAKLTD